MSSRAERPEAEAGAHGAPGGGLASLVALLRAAEGLARRIGSDEASLSAMLVDAVGVLEESGAAETAQRLMELACLELGVEKIAPESIDPEREAPPGVEIVQMRHDEGSRPGRVLEVMSVGYRSKETLLRPARLVVSRGPRPPALKALRDLVDARGSVEPFTAILAAKAALVEQMGAAAAAGEDGDALVLQAYREVEAEANAGALKRGEARPFLEGLLVYLTSCGYEPVYAPSYDLVEAAGGIEGLEFRFVFHPQKKAGTVITVRRMGFRKEGRPIGRTELDVSQGPRHVVDDFCDLLEVLAARGGDAAAAGQLVCAARDDLRRIRFTRQKKEAQADLLQHTVDLIGYFEDHLEGKQIEVGIGEEEGAPGPQTLTTQRLAGVRDRLLTFLEASGVESFPTGDAVTVAEGLGGAYETSWADHDSTPGSLLETTRKGFRISDRLLRRARVSLSRGPRPPVAALLDRLEAEPPAGCAPARVAEVRRSLLDHLLAPDVARVPALARSLIELIDRAEGINEEPVVRFLSDIGLTPFPQGASVELRRLVAQEGLFDHESAFADKPAGQVLELRRTGFLRGDEVVRKAALTVSLGPRPFLLDFARRIASDAPDEAAGRLDQLANRIEDLLRSKAFGDDPGDQILRLAVEVLTCFEERVEPRYGVDREKTGRIIGLKKRIVEDLAEQGLTVLPATEEIDLAQVTGHQGKLDVEVTPHEAPRGQVVRVERWGFLIGDEVLRRGKVVVSRGPKDALERILDRLDAVLAAAGFSEEGLAGAVAALRSGLAQPGQTRETVTGVAALYGRLEDLFAARRDESPGKEVRELLDKDLGPYLTAAGARWIPAARRLDVGAGGKVEGCREVVWEWAEADHGAVIDVRQRGIVIGDETVREAVVVVSRGPKPTLLQLAEGLAAILGGSFPAGMDLVRAIRDEFSDATKPADSAFRPERFDRVLQLVRYLEGEPSAAQKTAAPVREFLDGALADYLASIGVQSFPGRGKQDLQRVGELRPHFESLEVSYSAETPSGEWIEMERRAYVHEGRVLSPGRARLSRGPRPEIVGLLDGGAFRVLFAGDVPAGPIGEGISKIRNLRSELEGLAFDHGDRQGVLSRGFQMLVALRGAAFGDAALGVCRNELTSFLAARGAEVVPAPGKGVRDYAAEFFADPVAEYSDDVAEGSFVSIAEPGLAIDGRIVVKARVVVSRGRKSEQMKLIDNLQRIADHCAQRALALDGEHAAALSQLRARFHHLSPEDQKGAAGRSLMAAAMNLCDAVAARHGRHGAEFGELVQGIGAGFVMHFQGTGATVFPAAGQVSKAEVSSAVAAIGGYAAVVEEEAAYDDDHPEGAILALAQRGLYDGGALVQKARLTVCHGPKTDSYRLLEKAMTPLGLFRGAPFFGRLGKTLGRLATTPPEKEYVPMLDALNLLSDLKVCLEEVEKSAGGDVKGLDTKVIKANKGLSYLFDLLDEVKSALDAAPAFDLGDLKGGLDGVTREFDAFLGARGFKKVNIFVGRSFEEYGVDKCDRKNSRSNKPSNQIIRVLRSGFTDAQNTIIQKATVEVSQ